jgi:hypothetical protein
LDELVFEVAARHREDVLAQPPDQDYNIGRRHTAYTVHFVAQQPQKQVHPKLWYRNPEKKRKI